MSGDPVGDYALRVVAGELVAGPHVRGACERHLRDREEGPERGLVWDLKAAQTALDFFPTVLRLAEGEFSGRPFELMPWQQFIVGSLFGWKLSDGTRRFRVAYIEAGKGSGKSPCLAGIGLYGLIFDNEPAAEIYCAAVTRDQAGILFRDATLMVENSPALRRRITITKNNLAFMRTASYMRPVSAEGRSLDGKRVHMALLDEVHEHKHAVVVEKMRAGTKGRRQALILMITNSGYDRASVCWQYHEYSRKVATGEVEDDSFFGYVAALDKEDIENERFWDDETCWVKANPGLDVILPRKYLREQVREARGMPSKQNIVKRLNFCIWTEAAKRWLDRDRWFAPPCMEKPDPRELAGETCYGGLDLSSTTDLTAFVLVFPRENGTVDVLPYFWLPEIGLMDKERRDGAPYTTWRDQGLLLTTPGRSIDEAFIAREIAECFERYDLRGIAFDRAGMKYLLPKLEDEGLTCDRRSLDRMNEDAPPSGVLPLYDWGQGFLGMAPAIKALEQLIQEEKLRHGGHKVLTMCAGNAVTAQDPAGNQKWDKARALLRIDGVVALSMACGLLKARANEERPLRTPPVAWVSWAR